MNKSYIILIVICIILASLVGVYYLKMPERSNTDTVNLSISAELDNQKIKTGYIIKTDYETIEGNTSQSYELEKIKKGQIVTVSNVNLDDQIFFTDVRTVNTSENKRVDLILKEPSEIKITKRLEGRQIFLNVSSEDMRNLNFCLDWSLSYIFVKPLEFNETDTPEEYKGQDCYNGFSLKDSTEQINITYQKFQEPNDDDFIKITIYPSELVGKTERIEMLL